MARRRWFTRDEPVTTKVRHANAYSVWMASSLGNLYGHGINGQTGTVRFGYPQIGMSAKYQGYGAPQQMFIGWSPSRVAGGTVRPHLGGLPGGQPPYTDIGPLLAAVSRVNGS
jgi:hypothetical protein